jgi:hypothetical protein
MSYTVSWQQLAFSEFTWSSLLTLLPRIVSCKYTPTLWDFRLTEGDDTVRIERYPPKYVYSKTSPISFTRDLIKTLILMVEFGAAKILKQDDSDMFMFLTILNELQSLHPLDTYEEQKKYFQGY